MDLSLPESGVVDDLLIGVLCTRGRDYGMTWDGMTSCSIPRHCGAHTYTACGCAVGCTAGRDSYPGAAQVISWSNVMKHGIAGQMFPGETSLVLLRIIGLLVCIPYTVHPYKFSIVLHHRNPLHGSPSLCLSLSLSRYVYTYLYVYTYIHTCIYT